MRRTLSAICMVLASMFVAAVPASAATPAPSPTDFLAEAAPPAKASESTYVATYDAPHDCQLAGLRGYMQGYWYSWRCWESDGDNEDYGWYYLYAYYY
jgi:hypothetical protein